MRSIGRVALPLSTLYGLIAIALPAEADTPKTLNCYIRDRSGKVLSLDRICEKAQRRMAPIDLDTDLNRDGVADELAAFVKKLDATKSLEAQAAILEDFERRLPYSAETRAIAVKSKGLSEQLMKAKTKEEIDRIKAKLADFERQAMKDPGYVKSMKALQQLTSPRLTP
jgi:hypothetical protein